jgi:hypothetical protein
MPILSSGWVGSQAGSARLPTMSGGVSVAPFVSILPTGVGKVAGMWRRGFFLQLLQFADLKATGEISADSSLKLPKKTPASAGVFALIRLESYKD